MKKLFIFLILFNAGFGLINMFLGEVLLACLCLSAANFTMLWDKYTDDI